MSDSSRHELTELALCCHFPRRRSARRTVPVDSLGLLSPKASAGTPTVRARRD